MGDSCDLTSYPPGGGDGSGTNPCDDWPDVPPGHVKGSGGCQCPPDKGAYNRAKAAAFFNFIPMIGQVVTGAIGQPGNCQDEFKDSADTYLNAQKAFVAMCEAIEDRFLRIVQMMAQIYTGDTTDGNPTGILPDAVRAALASGMHTTMYLIVIAIAVFLVLLGVVFTM